MKIQLATILSALALAAHAQNDTNTPAAASPPDAPRLDILIADFEEPQPRARAGGWNAARTVFGPWEVTGSAFGQGPAHGTIPGQQPVVGVLGTGYASSFHGGDGAVGMLTSPAFTIERKYIRFLIAGGNMPGKTCVNLLLEGKVVHTATGMNNERLTWKSWDVAALEGKKAQIQIVDNATVPWGHIEVDHILATDDSGNPSAAGAAPQTLAGGFYIVVAGDTPASICQKFQISLPELWNSNLPRRRLTAGMRLIIPARTVGMSPAMTAAEFAPVVEPAAQTIQPGSPMARRRVDPVGQPAPMLQRGLPTTTALAPGQSASLRLDEFSHALDVQLVDKLGASKLFSVIEDKDLKDALHAGAGAADAGSHRKLAIAAVNAVPTLANRYGLATNPPPYDLKNTQTLEQFNNAGIGFLLITTVEDMDENHIDGATVTRDYEYDNGHATGWWVEDLSGGSDSDSFGLHRSGAAQASYSWRHETIRVNPMTQKEQSLRVTLRSRLYDAKTGELLGSKNKTYARGRSYLASARGNNDLSMGDLYQTAAGDLADWMRLVVEDEAFPIKIVKIEEEEVLINRGSETGIRQNTYYDAWVQGDEIKDPDTNEVLGREEKKVGKVLIRELQTKFARASITENNGIKPGAVLRLNRGG